MLDLEATSTTEKEMKQRKRDHMDQEENLGEIEEKKH